MWWIVAWFFPQRARNAFCMLQIEERILESGLVDHSREDVSVRVGLFGDPEVVGSACVQMRWGPV